MPFNRKYAILCGCLRPVSKISDINFSGLKKEKEKKARTAIAKARIKKLVNK